MMDELEKWVRELEAQIPATRKLIQQLREERRLEQQYQQEKSEQLPP